MSLNSQIRSNLDASGASRSVSANDCIMLALPPLYSNRPLFGLAAAKTAQRELRVAVIPPFATLTFCCSIAGCIALLSCFPILSNSSIAANPRSERGRTPASNANLPSENPSFTAAAVSPADVTEPPEANFPRGDRLDM